MKRGLLIACLLVGLLLPCLLPCLGLYGAAASTDTEEEPLPEETQENREDTFLMTEASSLMSASSGVANRWTGTYPAGAGAVKDPLDAGRDVAFVRHTLQAAATTFTVKYCKMSAENTYLIADQILLPGAAQSELATSPTALSATLFGTTFLTLTEDGDRYAVQLADGTAGAAPKGAWVRLTIAYDGATSMADVALFGDLTGADGAPCTELRMTAKCALTNTDTFHYRCTMPAKATEEQPVCGFYHRTSIRVPGDMYLLSAGLKKIDGDTALNTHRDGDLTLTFSHDLDPAKLDLTRIRVTDTDGNPLPVTAIRHPVTQLDCLILNFASDPLPKFSTVLVHFDAGVTDLFGQTLSGEMYAAIDVLGDKGDLRPRMPIVEIPEEQHIMPDVYNTGYRCPEGELEPLLEKYPLLKDSMGYGGNATTVVITDKLAAAYNYRFEKFTYTGSLRFTGTKPITIEDAFLHCETQHYAIENVGSAYLTISYLEGTGSQSSFIQGGNMKLSHIYLHDIGGDHMKSGSNQWLEYSYFRDGGTHNPMAHADCIQFSGTPNEIIDNIVIIGNRMDVPPLLWDHTANCTLFFKTEAYSAGYTNVQMIGNWVNGGGFTVYLTVDSSTPEGIANTRYITFKDNMYGYGGRWGALTWGKKTWGTEDAFRSFGGEFSGNGYMQTLDAGSVLLRDGAGNLVADLASVTDGTFSVDVHFANYLLAARQYRIAVRVVAGDGTVLAEQTADGEIRKYIHYDDYATDDNIEDMLDEDGNPIVGKDGQGNDVRFQRLIKLPDLPEDVLGSITLSGLPADLSGCRAEVVVYDTTGDASTEVRKADFRASGTYSVPLAIEGASLTLNARPEIKFCVAASELAELPAGATLYLIDSDGGRYTGTDRDDYRVFSVPDISVADMGRDREYRLQYQNPDGTLVTSSLSVTYSPLTYAIRMYRRGLTDTTLRDEALRALLVSIAQYAEAAGSTGAAARFTQETGYTFDGGEVGDYEAIRARAAKQNVNYDQKAAGIARLGATLGTSIDLVLSLTDARYTRVTATIANDRLDVSMNGTEVVVRGLRATDLYGVITLVFSGDGVETVTATLTVAHFLDGYGAGGTAALARATALYMDAVLSYVKP